MPPTATSAAALSFPPGRYGRRRDPVRQRRRRWLTVAVAGLVALAGVMIAEKLYRQYVQAPYQVTNVNTTKIWDAGFTVTFDVSTPAGQGATCTVQGHTRDGQLVGQAQVDVPPVDAQRTTLHVTFTLNTTARPMTGEVQGCGPRQ
jgi:hypothetical protein